MKFHKQIFPILILAILVVTVASTSAQHYNGAEDKQITSFEVFEYYEQSRNTMES